MTITTIFATKNPTNDMLGFFRGEHGPLERFRNILSIDRIWDVLATWKNATRSGNLEPQWPRPLKKQDLLQAKQGSCRG